MNGSEVWGFKTRISQRLYSSQVSTWVHKCHYWAHCSCKHSYEPALHVQIGKMSVESYDFERLGYVQVRI